MTRHVLISLLLCLLLAACASAPSAPECTRLGRNGQLCLLPPAQLPAVDASHLVSIMHDGQSRMFMGRLKIDARTLQLAGSSLFGTGLFDIHYDGKTLTMQPPQDKLRPELLVAVLELTLADPARLRPRLHALTLEVADHGATQTRTLYESGKAIVHIETTGATPAQALINITIPPIGLTLQMTPLTAAADKP